MELIKELKANRSEIVSQIAVECSKVYNLIEPQSVVLETTLYNYSVVRGFSMEQAQSWFDEYGIPLYFGDVAQYANGRIKSWVDEMSDYLCKAVSDTYYKCNEVFFRHFVENRFLNDKPMWDIDQKLLNLYKTKIREHCSQFGDWSTYINGEMPWDKLEDVLVKICITQKKTKLEEK